MESTVRARVPGQINFYTASVENPRFDEEGYRESLAETLRRGYGGVKLDLVVAATYQVLEFALQYRDKMFPGVPIVFTDVARQEAEKMWPGVTGVIVPVGVRETIDLALQLHPDTTTIAIVSGVSQWDKYWLTVAHSELLRRQDKVREIDLVGPAGLQVLKNVADLPAHTVVLFQLRPDDLTQPAFEPIDILTAVAQHLPTYSAWPGLALNRGGVGGAYRDLPKEAVLNGEIVARVLSGERLENVPIVRDSDLKVRRGLAGASALAHSGIGVAARRRNRVPAAYLLAARPEIHCYCHRPDCRPGVVDRGPAFAANAQTEGRSCSARERRALQSDGRYHSIACLDVRRPRQDYLPELPSNRVYRAGPDDAGYGDNWIAHVHPDDVERVLDTLYEALKSKQPFSQEYRLRRGDGVYRWMFDVASPRVNGDGSFGGFIGSAIDTTDQKLAQQALEKISGQLIEAQEQERSRIARDLHDDICQRLALLAMEIGRANRSSNGSLAATDQNLDNIRKHCSEIACDVQSLSHQLHSSTLDYLGVVAAIKAYCSEVSKQHQVSVEFTDSNVPKHLPKDTSLCLFRIAQEALHNAVKYSGTNEFLVALYAIGAEIQLVVRDAGAGFDVEEAKKNRGLGLISMQERANLVRGRFAVDSKPGTGTRIFAAVPFVAEDQRSPQDAPGKKDDSMREVA